MRNRFGAWLAMIFIADASLANARQMDRSSDPEVYQSLSRELPSLPLPLLSKEGNPLLLENAEDGTLTFQGGAILDTDGRVAVLPDHARFKPLDGRAGQYLVEHAELGRPVLRLAQLQDAKLILGPTMANPYQPGSLTPLPDGSVASIVGGDRSATSVTFNAFLNDNGNLEVGIRSVIKRIPIGYLALGAVKHPRTEEAGYAFSDQSSVMLAFPSEPDIKIALDKGVRVFAAGEGQLIVGFFNPECPAKNGLPQGTCTPFLFNVPLPERNLSLSVESLSQYTMVATSRSGWTFGALHKVDERSDFRLVGDRLYTIMYQGMNQSFGYFSLSKPGVSKTIIPPAQGSDLSFSLIAGDAGDERLFVERRHLVEPVKFHLVASDDTVDLVYEAAESPTVAAADLGFKAYPARADSLLSPMIILGRRDTIDTDVCAGGLALVEVYGGPGVAMRPSNPVGLIPGLFEKNGIHVIVSLPGSGGYGLPWIELGSFENSANQILSLSQTLRVLENNGCGRIVLTGFSHGGVVSLNTAVRYPDLVDAVVIGGAPLDLEREYAGRNPSIAAFLPNNAMVSPSDGSLPMLSDAVWEGISPRRSVEAASDLSGLAVTIFAGAQDNRASTYTSDEIITAMRSKGAEVEIVMRPRVGHQRFANRDQWAEYHSILGTALSEDR
jgi:pimeloyl-ACP methyl ester carboxylesterase